MNLAGRTRRYVRGLTIGQGRHAGEPFDVLRWQGAFMRGALADGVSESALSLARGGGKSTLTAALACAALDGPLAAPAGEVLIVASSHEQGQIVFRHVLRFLAPKIEAGEFRVADTVNTSRLTSKATGTMLVVKGSDPKRLHGSAPVLTIADELAQWPTPRIAEMLAALRTAAGKIPGSRLLLIGTRPADEAHPFATALREADYSQVHAARPGDSPFARSTWRRANPRLAHMPDLEAAIAREAKAAKRDPSLTGELQGVAAQHGHGGHRTGDAARRRNMGADRRRRGARRAAGLGARPGHERGAIGRGGVLAGHGATRGTGGVPLGAFACRARTPRRVRRALHALSRSRRADPGGPVCGRAADVVPRGA